MLYLPGTWVTSYSQIKICILAIPFCELNLISCLKFLYVKWSQGKRNIQGITLDMGKRQEISITDGLRHNFMIHSFFQSAFAYFREMCKNCFPSKQENEKAVTLQTDCFKPMVDLRLLEINYVALDRGFKYIPAKLKWLQWKGCPLKTFPFDCCLEDLGVLDLSESKITSMWGRGHSKKQVCYMKILTPGR